MERTKQQERQELNEQMAAFLASGKTITKIDAGQSALKIDAFVARAKEALSKVSSPTVKKIQSKRKPQKNKISEDDDRYPAPGKRYGSLVVKEQTINSCNHRAWICVCDCGRTTGPIPTSKLSGDIRKSCGCIRKAPIRKRNSNAQESGV